VQFEVLRELLHSAINENRVLTGQSDVVNIDRNSDPELPLDIEVDMFQPNYRGHHLGKSQRVPSFSQVFEQQGQ
jgi:hypothetical protein